MIPLVGVRVLSFMAMGSLSLCLDKGLASCVYCAVMFGHCVAHLIYSRAALESYRSHPLPLLRWVLFIGFFSLVSYTDVMSAVLYFGIHFVLSEVYTGRLALNGQLYRISRWVVAASTYVLFVRQERIFQSVSLSPVILVLGLALFGVYWTTRGMKEQAEVLSYDLVGAVLAILMPTLGEFRLRDIAFYHFIWWILYPISSAHQGSRNPDHSAPLFLALNVGVSLLFFLFTPAVGWVPLSYNQMASLADWFGNLHITLTFALSPSNPAWVIAFFQRPRWLPTAFPGSRAEQAL